MSSSGAPSPQAADLVPARLRTALGEASAWLGGGAPAPLHGATLAELCR